MSKKEIPPQRKSEIPIGAGYYCYECGHQEENVMWDHETLPETCTKCGKKDRMVYVVGKIDCMCFIFTYKTVQNTINWQDRAPETRTEGVWTLVNAYEDGRTLEEDYKKIKTNKENVLVKAILSWSSLSGVYLSRVDGLKVRGFPFGFSLNELIKGAKIGVLPDSTQIWRQIERFVQRYWMGYVKLKDDR